ncbi:hypothetical protein CW304_14805 [Bacillus sp. UFRGS-B20]|nr:hypothetical protein CW304_14805 [Bacillus sp. UFRGS-B20]
MVVSNYHPFNKLTKVIPVVANKYNIRPSKQTYYPYFFNTSINIQIQFRVLTRSSGKKPLIIDDNHFGLFAIQKEVLSLYTKIK